MTDLSDNKLGIKCQWMKNKRVLVNPDGQVYPCCYFAGLFAMDILGHDPDKWEIERYGLWRKGDKVKKSKSNALTDYSKVKELHNIKNNSMEDILNSEWFIKTLPESWNDSDRCHRLCKKHCGVGSD